MSGSIRSYIHKSFVEPIAAHRAMAAIVILMVVMNLFFGERVQAGGGLGWDGVTYANLVRHVDEMIRSDTLGTYYAQRVLPAFIIRMALVIAQSPMNNYNIIFAFLLFNSALCIALTVVWKKICDSLSFGIESRWIGFAGLFINYEFSKQNMFSPVLTDTVAMFLSGVLLLLFIQKRRLGILVLSVIGAFCWPTLAISGALLVLLMEQSSSTVVPYTSSEAAGAYLFNKKAAILLALAAFLMLISTNLLPVGRVICGYAGMLPGARGGVSSKLDLLFGPRVLFQDPCLLAQQTMTALPSCLLLALAIYVMGMPLIRRDMLKGLASKYRVQSFALSLVILVVSTIGLRWISNPAVENPSSISELARLILLPPPGKIFLPLVSAAVFWGPVLMVAALMWPRISRAARNMGPGIPAVICITLPFGLVGEPRFITTIWPMIVVLTASVLGDEYKDRRYGILILSSIFFAQFWLPLNIAPWTGGDSDGLQQFPKQLLFMHYGLWMSWPTYVLQSIALVVTSLLLLRYLRSSSLPGNSVR
jgi:hypothetical protein